MALEGAAQEAPREPCTSLEDGVPNGGFDADRAVGEAPLDIAAKFLFLARLANAACRRLKGPDMLVLNSPIIPMKWEQSSLTALVPSPDISQSIIDR